MDIKHFLEVIPVNSESEFAIALINALSFPGIKPEQKIENTFHYRYFINYLYKESNGLKASTVIIENDYTSVSYLGDYINYYAHCYFPYQKQCRRVHFFGAKFDLDTFLNMVQLDSPKENWESYLGNIVIRPLPRGVIGATLIKPYEKKQNRFYTAIKEYSINLFGKPLKIKTLPYQEQDGIVHSCASSALWFALQKAADLFQSSVPTPSDITISAGFDTFYTGKNFPSSSLEINQICKAIAATGLISEVRDASDFTSDSKWAKSFMYAYSRMGIPILLGINLENEGAHLVTMNGYRFQELEDPIDITKSNIKLDLISTYINKVYAHDDQIGPFARLEFLTNSTYQLKTSCWENIKSETALGADISVIIVPLKNSIKVTFEHILDRITLIDFLLRKLLSVSFKWDIFLIESNSYKDHIRKKLGKNSKYDVDAKEILLKSLPQYIWVAQAKIFVQNDGRTESHLIFDLIYDAVDVNLKPYYTNIYNRTFKEIIDTHDVTDEVKFFEHKLSKKESERIDLYTILSEDQTIINRIEDLEDSIKGRNDNMKPSDIVKEVQENNLTELRDSSRAQQENIMELKRSSQNDG